MKRLPRILLNTATVLSLLLCVAAIVLLVAADGRPPIATGRSIAYRESVGRLWVEGRDILWLSFTPDRLPPADGQPHPYFLRRDSGGRFLGIVWTRDSQIVDDRQSATAFRRGGRMVTFRVPWYWPPSLTLPLPGLWLGRTLRQRMRKHPGRCRTCGYDLRATPDRCPECGAITAAA